MSDRENMSVGMSAMEKLYELNRLRAAGFDEALCPEQRKYYLELNEFYRQHNCRTIEEATEIIKGTPFFDGMTRAKILDEINCREKAMREAGYDEAAELHAERREKFLEKGMSYVYSQEWIDGYEGIEKKIIEYNRRKEVFGSVFMAYFNAFANPQQEHRRAAAGELKSGLDKLAELGASFDELVQERAYRELMMMTEAGRQRFIDCVHRFLESGNIESEETADVAEEQSRIGRWAKSHQQELMKAAEEEKWHCANCVAVPSADPGGYDYISVKEVSE